jgi:tetratricopeptide (TPR) repeat protein
VQGVKDNNHMKLILRLTLFTIIIVSCSDNKDISMLSTQNLSEEIKKSMRDSIDRILLDSIRAKKKINEIPYYYAMYSVDTLNPKYIIKYANQLGIVGQYKPSFDLLNKAICYTSNKAKLYRCKGDIWQYIATASAQQNLSYSAQLDSSLFYYEKACITDTNDVELFVTLCLAHKYLKKYDEALIDIEHAIQLQPNNKDHILFRGCVKVELKDYQGAYEDLKVITPFRRIDPSMYYHRALAESYLNKLIECKLDLDTCIVLSPDNPSAYYFRGVCRTNIKDKYNGWLDIKKAYDLGYPVPEKEYKIMIEKLSEKKL